MFLLLERYCWLYRQNVKYDLSMFTSKHTHPLGKTNNNPIYDCDKLYSNIQGEILLSQNKMLMTSKDLWINLLLSK